MRGLGFAHNILFKEKGLTEAFSEDLNCGRSEMEFFFFQTSKISKESIRVLQFFYILTSKQRKVGVKFPNLLNSKKKLRNSASLHLR